MSSDRKRLPPPPPPIYEVYPPRQKESPVPTSFGHTGPNYRYGRAEGPGTLHVPEEDRWLVKKQ